MHYIRFLIICPSFLIRTPLHLPLLRSLSTYTFGCRLCPQSNHLGSLVVFQTLAGLAFL
uniref:DNA-cytosine methyltransferase n=1 Tax=uncultured marine virus TaxID=186617 RepID=A0A0F7L4C5_9VIRU|nr:DNA-cytosine methyltransferase [uncultured marine virus]